MSATAALADESGSAPTESAKTAPPPKLSPLERVKSWLTPPDPFGVSFGRSTPEQIAARFNVKIADSRCAEPAKPGLRVLCWGGPIALPHAQEIIATFGDGGGDAPVLRNLAIRFSADAWQDLHDYMIGDWGLAEPSNTDERMLAWHWGQMDWYLSRDADEVSFKGHADDLPVFARQAKPQVNAEPWGVRLGDQTYDEARVTLAAAGFRPGISECMDIYPLSKTRAVLSCELEAPASANMSRAKLDYVQFAGGVRLISSLSFNFKTSTDRKAIIEDLRSRYGSEKNAEYKFTRLTWQVGPVEIELTDVMGDDSIGRWFTLTYAHTRLRSIGYGAQVENEIGKREQVRKGL
ncbi:MAG: hypothetical protein QM778_18835 [Myxococcales bacterium]